MVQEIGFHTFVQTCKIMLHEYGIWPDRCSFYTEPHTMLFVVKWQSKDGTEVYEHKFAMQNVNEDELRVFEVKVMMSI